MSLLRTPLYEEHIKLSGQMVPFGGWELPVRYSSDKAEHMAVRTKAGLFDVSHMGEISLKGPRALEAAEILVTNSISRLSNGQAAYAGLLNPKGNFVDDVVAYRFTDHHILLCVNASNREKDFSHILQALASFSSQDLQICNESDQWAQVAIQGPLAAQIVAQLYGESIHAIKRYHFDTQKKAVLARTGYTGEDGFEIFIERQEAGALWKSLLDVGAPLGLLPCGLGARDTLRLEAGMCLYGNDIDETTSPLEAGLDWIVKFQKPWNFIGRTALEEQKNTGLRRRLVGLTLNDKGIARHGYAIRDKEQNLIGHVTSGTFSPYLEKAIAMAYIQIPFHEPSTPVWVQIRDRLVEAQTVSLPFYKRNKESL